MDFASGLLQSYKTKWSYVNSFTVDIDFSPITKRFINWTTQDSRDVNLNIISIDTPQFTNSAIEVYVGDRWRTHVGRDELYRFSMTFRDRDQMDLYKKFVSAYLMQKTSYFDDAKMKITLWKDADYKDEKNKILYEFQDVIIESVSQIQFNTTTENQIAEFSVNFKTATPILDISYFNSAKIKKK